MPNLEPLTDSAIRAGVTGATAGGIIGAADAVVGPETQQVSRGISRLTVAVGLGAPVAAHIAMQGGIVSRQQALAVTGAGVGLAGAWVLSSAVAGAAVSNVMDGVGMSGNLSHRLRLPLPA